jgi:hypothetical protein
MPRETQVFLRLVRSLLVCSQERTIRAPPGLETWGIWRELQTRLSIPTTLWFRATFRFVILDIAAFSSCVSKKLHIKAKLCFLIFQQQRLLILAQRFCVWESLSLQANPRWTEWQTSVLENRNRLENVFQWTCGWVSIENLVAFFALVEGYLPAETSDVLQRKSFRTRHYVKSSSLWYRDELTGSLSFLMVFSCIFSWWSLQASNSCSGAPSWQRRRRFS